MPTLEPGARVAQRYQLLRPIGEGGMGVVWVARGDGADVDVAIKFLKPREGDAHGGKRLLREARAAGAIDHPNVVRILQVIELDDGAPAIVMELLDGESLAARLEREGAIEVREVAKIHARIASALAAAHARGIVHRDLKPDNVVVTTRGEVKVLDFGIAKLPVADGGATGTSTAGIFGTPAYMAPEQLFGERDVDGRADLWALGLMLFESLTGTLPTRAENVGQMTKIILTGRIPPIAEVAPGLPEELAALVDGLITRSRDDRPGDTGEVERALDRIAAGDFTSSSAASRPRGLAPPPARVRGLSTTIEAWRASGVPLRRRRSILLMLAAAAVAAAALTSLAVIRFRAAPSVAGARRVVAVLGFKNLSDKGDAAWLSTAFAEMLTTELGAGDRLRTVPGETVARMKRDLRIDDAASLEKATLERVNANVGADFVVTGTYVEAGDAKPARVRLDVNLQDASRGEPITSISEQGTTDDIFEMVTRAGAELRRRLGAGPLTAVESSEVRSALPTNSEAAKLFVEGLAKVHALDPVGARASFEKAIALDPSEPRAHAALADVFSGLAFDALAEKEAKLALDYGARLRQDERLVIEARWHAARHEWQPAVDAYKKLFSVFSDDIEIGLKLADVQSAGGKPKDALATTVELRKLPPPSGQDPRLDLQEALADDDLGDAKGELDAADRAIAGAKTRGERWVAMRATLQRALALYNLGRSDECRATSTEALNLAEALGDRYGMGMSRLDSALAIAADDPAESMRWQEAAALDLHAVGAKLFESIALTNAGLMSTDIGDLASARSLFDRARVVVAEIDYKEAVNGLLIAVARVDADAGEVARALAALEEARRGFVAIGDKRLVAWCDELRGEVMRLTGDLAVARKLEEESLTVREGLGLAVFVADSRLVLARIAIDDGRGKDAEAEARSAIAGYAANRNPDGEARAHAALARALMLEKRDDEARVESGVAAKRARTAHRYALLVDSAIATLDTAKPEARADAERAVEALAKDAVERGIRTRAIELRFALARARGTKGVADLVAVAKDAHALGLEVYARR